MTAGWAFSIFLVVGGMLFALGSDLIEEENGADRFLRRHYALGGLFASWGGCLALVALSVRALGFVMTTALWTLAVALLAFVVFGLFHGLRRYWFRPWMEWVDTSRRTKMKG